MERATMPHLRQKAVVLDMREVVFEAAIFLGIETEPPRFWTQIMQCLPVWVISNFIQKNLGINLGHVTQRTQAGWRQEQRRRLDGANSNAFAHHFSYHVQLSVFKAVLASRQMIDYLLF